VAAAGSPRCFMHVPKCAGSSIYASLVKALPPGSVSMKMMDATMLDPGIATLDSLPPRYREIVAGTPEEIAKLAEAAVVSGHFRLSTLTRVTSPESIGTVLREPRARLLSQYVFWRTQVHNDAPQFQPREQALRPLGEFLSEPSLAHATDNLVCRILLEPDRRIPTRAFIAPNDVEAVALSAAAKLDALGFVGVLELGDMVWRGLSRLFGVVLTPNERNVTGRRGLPAETAPLARPFTARTIELLQARTGADAVVYQHALAAAQCTAEDCAWLPVAAFANQLVQLGDSAGHSAMWLTSLENELQSGNHGA
jgi:hypothetical protein